MDEDRRVAFFPTSWQALRQSCTACWNDGSSEAVQLYGKYSSVPTQPTSMRSLPKSPRGSRRTGVLSARPGFAMSMCSLTPENAAKAAGISKNPGFEGWSVAPSTRSINLRSECEEPLLRASPAGNVKCDLHGVVARRVVTVAIPFQGFVESATSVCVTGRDAAAGLRGSAAMISTYARSKTPGKEDLRSGHRPS